MFVFKLNYERRAADNSGFVQVAQRSIPTLRNHHKAANRKTTAKLAERYKKGAEVRPSTELHH